MNGETPSAAVVAAAQRTASITDARGRKIEIRKLSLFDEMRLIEGLGPVANNSAYLLRALFIASVVSIDGVPESPVRTKEQLEALMGRVDDSFEAIIEGHDKHFKKGESGDPLK